MRRRRHASHRAPCFGNKELFTQSNCLKDAGKPFREVG
jgi:hypothetical protein